ncbi:MAG: glycosyltransferase family 2 protein [Clostridia bacterium]|nr:glycosyltransferase family 2 protein [Clostridia bacterium]
MNQKIEKKEQKKPLFSIIIPMKNAQRYIGSALNSIANQNFNNIEVFVIDDNSDKTDNSKKLVQSWKTQHPNINLKLFETTKDNGGPGGARNIGLDNATGKYVLFLDADDVLNKNALKSIKKSIDENPNTDIFVLGYQLTRRNSDEIDQKTWKFPAGKLQESRLFQIGANTAGAIWNTCIKRKLFGEKDDNNNIRFKPNCKFEDLPTKVWLFVRNKKKIKSVKTITHTQYSRPNASITGTLSLSDMKRLAEAHYEIANIKNRESNINLRDKIYISARKVSFIGVSSWLIQKAFRNKLDRKRQQKEQERPKDEAVR